MKTWTKPFYGVSHYGNSSDLYRSTIEEYGSFVDLDMWFPGCGFSPKTATFSSVAEAKSAGEAWANQMERAA